MPINTVSPISFKGVYFTKSAEVLCTPKAKQKISALAKDPGSPYEKDVFVEAYQSNKNTESIVKVDVYNLYAPVYKYGVLESIDRVHEKTYFRSAEDFEAVPMTRA